MIYLNKYGDFTPVENVVIPINYDDEGNSRFIKKLRPVVFRREEDYCCLLGPNLEHGIAGCGVTPDNAIINWEQQIMSRLENLEDNDTVALEARKMLISNKPLLRSV
jgi:hypothetical protein